MYTLYNYTVYIHHFNSMRFTYHSWLLNSKHIHFACSLATSIRSHSLGNSHPTNHMDRDWVGPTGLFFCNRESNTIKEIWFNKYFLYSLSVSTMYDHFIGFMTNHALTTTHNVCSFYKLLYLLLLVFRNDGISEHPSLKIIRVQASCKFAVEFLECT